MRKSPKNAFAEWETLLQAVRETEGDLGCVTPFREALANAQAQALTFKALRDSLEASVGDADHRLRKAVTAGEDAAVSLRGFIRSVLGVRNEKLLRYGILPLGGRHRRARDKVREVSIT
jgi:hypothetical protein